MELSKFIPQLFFDVIARIMPGSALMVGGAVAADWNLSEKALVPFGTDSNLGNSSIFFVFVFLGASYVLGHLLGPLSQLLEEILKRWLPERLDLFPRIVSGDTEWYPEPVCDFLSRTACFDLQQQNPKPSDPRQHRYYTSLLYLWLDRLRLQEPAVGARLVKIRAESKMQSQLAIAAGAVGIFHVLSALLMDRSCWNPPLVVTTVVVAALAIWNYGRLHRIFQLSVINHYYAAYLSHGWSMKPALVPRLVRPGYTKPSRARAKSSRPGGHSMKRGHKASSDER